MLGGRGDIPMLVPPVATGSAEGDDESVGLSTYGNGRQVLSDRSRGRESKSMAPAGVPGGPHDFKKAYMQVSDVLIIYCAFIVIYSLLRNFNCIFFYLSFTHLVGRRYGIESSRWCKRRPNRCDRGRASRAHSYGK